jgi:hypothetical protein
MPDAKLTLRVVAGVSEIPAAVWNACAGADEVRPLPADSIYQPTPDNPLISHPNRTAVVESESQPQHNDSFSQNTPPNPFVSHEFLSALEASGCVGEATGWTPLPLIAQTAAGEIVGVAPLYAKGHSQGEYVFDHAWADAYERAGGRYYPKLQVAVPFTPATGPRLLTRPGPDAAQVRRALAQALESLPARLGASSTHVTFPTEAEATELGEQGWLPRLGEQFQFRNEGYRDYEDFLSTLVSRKRKALRRERREALESGVEIDLLTGAAITEAHWDAFFAFYMDTGSRKWGRPYLNRAFFSRLGESLADRVLLVMARRGRRPIAGALNLIGADALYGRYWGSVEDVPFLHFELCYHQAIDFALAKGLSRVEAGAQGEHKLARGYRPTPTWSAHFIRDPGLRRAVADYLARERAQMRDVIAADEEDAPFKKTPELRRDPATSLKSDAK